MNEIKKDQREQISGQVHQEEMRTQINKIRNESGEIASDTSEIEKKIREHYANTLHNIEEIET